MAKFIKDVVKPGRYTLSNGKVLSLSADDVAHLNGRVGEMVKAGLRVPVAWGHQSVVPMTRAEALEAKVKGTLGHVGGSKLDGAGLVATLDVPNKDDAARLPSIKYVSPEIRKDWTDGTGRKWPGLSITHVAVTANPVDPHQQAFKSAQMSRDVFRLALDDIDDEAEGEEVVPEAPAEEEAPGTSGKAAKIAALVEALKAHGFNIPDGVDDLDKLCIAVQSNDNDSVERVGDGEGLDAAAGITEPAASPMLMSLDDSNDPRDRRILTQERQNLARRAAALVGQGKVPGDVVKTLRADLSKERLYLDVKGDVAGGKALARLEAYEALPGSPFVTHAQLSMDGITEQEMPDDQARDDAEMRKLARERAARVSVTARRA